MSRPPNLNDDLEALSLAPEAPESGKKRTALYVLLIVLLLVVAAGALIFGLGALRSGPPRVHLAEAAPKTRWAAAVVLIATGHVEPAKRVFATSPIPGRVKQVLVHAGQSVSADDVVAELDPAVFEAGLAEQKAALMAAKAKLKAARRKLSQEQARAKKEKLPANDPAAVEREQAISLAQAQLGAALTEQKAVEARIVSLKLGLENTQVKAPMSGLVAKVVTSEGQGTSEGALQVAEIVDTSTLLVEADVAEAKLGMLRVGMPADVTLDAFPNRHFDAAIAEIKPEVDKETSTAVVRLKLKDPSSDVLLNMAARVSFLSKAIDAATRNAAAQLTVPADAVVDRAGKKVVFVYRGGAVVETPVVTGEKLGADVEVTGGLNAQDRIVVSPPDRLASGDNVEVER